MAETLDRGGKLYSSEHGHRTAAMEGKPEDRPDTVHQHGSMDITEHQRTFEHFIWFWIYLAAAVVVVLLFLAIFVA